MEKCEGQMKKEMRTRERERTKEVRLSRRLSNAKPLLAVCNLSALFASDFSCGLYIDTVREEIEREGEGEGEKREGPRATRLFRCHLNCNHTWQLTHRWMKK